MTLSPFINMVAARCDGIHDALVVLNDRMATKDEKYSAQEVEIEFQPYGSTLYFDYVYRCEGDNWESD